MKYDPTYFDEARIKDMRNLVDGELSLGFMFLSLSPCGRFRRYQVFRANCGVIENITQSVVRLVGGRLTSSLNLSIEGTHDTVLARLNERVQAFLSIARGYVTHASKFTQVEANIKDQIQFTCHHL
jgi:VIT1/CCC1 family predicted Fe2+/Mn2+ transporter